MLDLLGIVVSTAAIMFVILRAVQLDTKLPWFEFVKPPSQQADSAAAARAPATSRFARRR